MSAPKPPPLLQPVCIVVGLLFGTAVFLAAKVLYPPPVDRLDVEHWDLLGAPVPEVTLQTLDDQPVSSQRFAGQEHLLFFADPGCALCDEVYPVLHEAAKAGLPVLMVAQHGLAEMRVKAVAEGFPFPVVYDSMSVLSDRLRVTGFPMAAWVGADGRLRKAAAGKSAVHTIVQLALAGRAAGTAAAGAKR